MSFTKTNHQNKFSTTQSAPTSAGATTTNVNAVPSVAAPFYIALDATNINGKYEVVLVTSKTASSISHAATTYDHSTAEQVRLVVPAAEMDEIATVCDNLDANLGDGSAVLGLNRQAIINPGGQDVSRVISQRGAVVSGTCNNWANHLLYYGVDRWLAYTSDANGIQQASFAGGYFGVYKANNAATNKLSQIQIIEAANSCGLRGKKLSFGFIADKTGTTAKDITVFILAMKAAGTADSVTNAPITAFGADGVRPTFNTTNYDVLYEGDFTATQMDGATRLTGTTSVIVPVDAKNIIFGVVNKQSNSAGDLYGGFKIKEVLLCAGDVALPFQPKSYEEELRACMRYYQTFAVLVETSTAAQGAVVHPTPLRTAVTASGGGAGYAEVNVSVYSLTPYQTTRNSQTLTWNAEL